MTADAGASPDYLDEAEKAIARGAIPELLTALALLDIARSLRDIRDEVRDWETWGLTIKKKAM